MRSSNTRLSGTLGLQGRYLSMKTVDLEILFRNIPLPRVGLGQEADMLALQNIYICPQLCQVLKPLFGLVFDYLLEVFGVRRVIWIGGTVGLGKVRHFEVRAATG